MPLLSLHTLGPGEASGERERRGGEGRDSLEWFFVFSWISGRLFKSWRLTGLYPWCAILFTAGFIVREMGAFDYEDLIKYIISVVLVYAAPCVSPRTHRRAR